ncbi:ferredoxin reductase family protein [Rhodalgimonas zhirmunskyi]|uniref:Ferric reductase-like transmembrane domain-containing protein n=1 Tax=Rhodalgimonas zhirmunskyi TaxID=2964767 RepID=A0AAJ1X495_9RHOB|nr:ferric reductase-like transmembrane domain-containing protein [Rhodoalgimonas zhirmunskyi]MDQ2094058.1 ferric reductase-like transmembrane domain-containing protein [Rhodoalgimonas zhirmunskyi]
MKNIKIALWSIPALLTTLWLAANLPFPSEASVIAIRNILVQYLGVLSIGAMSVAMILATRARWIEPWLNGLDKSYRLHKWLGISALVTAILHWVAAMGPKWAVALGLFERPQRGSPPAGAADLPALQQFFNSQRGTAEAVGEWAFYAAAFLIVLALIKRFPYKYFASTHTLIAVAYLALVGHAVVLLDYSEWTQPLGIVLALLMAGGVVSAVLALTRQIGRRSRVSGTITKVHSYPDLHATEVSIELNDGWKGHQPGQFAFVTFDPKEGKHPFTIASAWNMATHEITVISKGLGDYTNILPQTLMAGGTAQVEGPYGRFTFNDDKSRQIWIGGGVGITPFIAKMKELAEIPGAKTIHLFHSTKEYAADAMDRLKADAKAAGVDLHILVDDRDGFLTGERLRALVPDWKSASVWFCGPAAFGQALQSDLRANGLSPDDFHQEMFNMR